jgi:DNA-binding NarL/FixJ family response regulator
VDHNGKAQSQPVVMIVDDEEMVITSVRAFLSLETDYDIHGFTDPEEAARFMETHPVDVVVSDYLMPKLNGIQLLAKAKQLQPEAARVLLTGHADKQSAIQAINDVGLFNIWKSRGTTLSCCSSSKARSSAHNCSAACEKRSRSLTVRIHR